MSSSGGSGSCEGKAPGSLDLAHGESIGPSGVHLERLEVAPRVGLIADELDPGADQTLELFQVDAIRPGLEHGRGDGPDRGSLAVVRGVAGEDLGPDLAVVDARPQVEVKGRGLRMPEQDPVGQLQAATRGIDAPEVLE